jgi:regulator of replication initiation timing
MMVIRRLTLGVMLGFTLLVVDSYAGELAGKQVAQSRNQIEELKQQIDEIQRQNQQQIQELQRKIEQLESQRAADKAQVEKVVTEEKDAWYKKFKAGYDKGFFLESDDGNFEMKMKFRSQLQFAVDNTDNKETGEKDTATNFNVRRFRIYWEGHAFRPWYNYVFQISADNNGNFVLRDAYFDAAYDTQIFPRLGQYKVPFNREELTSSSELQLVDRSIVNDQFKYGRDRGVGAYGLLANMFTYGAGVYNGDGLNGTSVDSNLLYVGRIQFNPCCGKLAYSSTGSFPIGGAYKLEPMNFKEKEPILAFGVAGATIPGLNIKQKTPDNNDLTARMNELGLQFADVTSITADVNFKYQIFSFTGEYDGRWIQPNGANKSIMNVLSASDLGTVYDQGFEAQAGIFLIPHVLELAGRYAYINFDNVESLNPDERLPDNQWAVTPGINYYITQDNRWKIQLDYNYIKTSFFTGADTNENLFRVQLQTYF